MPGDIESPDPLEVRTVRPEATGAQIEKHLSSIESGLDEILAEIRSFRRDMNTGFAELRAAERRHFLWTLGVVVVALLLALGNLARAP